jgi:hypothetical protein
MPTGKNCRQLFIQSDREIRFMPKKIINIKAHIAPKPAPTTQPIPQAPQQLDPIRLLVWGDSAFFPQHHNPTETVPVMNLVAARGILESIYRAQRGMEWSIDSIAVLNSIRYAPTSDPDVKCLTDVRYIITAHIIPLNRSTPSELRHEARRHTNKFINRAQVGEFFSVPTLGWAEYRAQFRLLKSGEMVSGCYDNDREPVNLGRQSWDLEYAHGSLRPRVIYANVSMITGVLKADVKK